MNDLQLELTRLIGRKDLSFGCIVRKKEGCNSTLYDDVSIVLFRKYDERSDRDYTYLGNPGSHWKVGADDMEMDENVEIIGHPATLTDLHRWINSKRIGWKQDKHYVKIGEYTDRFGYDWWRIEILYDSNKDLLGQDKSTLREIIDLIKKHEIQND